MKPHRNEDLYRAMQERRRSSASTPHDSRPNRERARKEAKTKSIKRSEEGNE